MYLRPCSTGKDQSFRKVGTVLLDMLPSEQLLCPNAMCPSAGFQFIEARQEGLLSACI